MTLWERIQAILTEARERTLGAVMEAMEARRRRRDAAIFSIALIALSAKMAKADGIVTADEVRAFGTFFAYPPEEEAKVRLVFQMAQQDTAGFETYARQVGRLFAGEDAVLEDVLDCLFYVALADGVAHPEEMRLLEVAAEAFALQGGVWRRVKAAHVGADKEDPFVILGLEPDADEPAIKAAYRKLARANHPDALIARGVPPELFRIAEHRMAAINTAYERALAGA
ncbi:TerB family tellurite resistance protein [Parvularcula dongshanensis]|uniref:DnaJ like chaperone protein n=1 Tax=Parvularcula dongshanensis TaxID=1173995 RepID=A0A840I3T1_9PROT|nr:TerB family tellurite resistance protein [Parvularcula dongshanensis]MBB4659437.1 DnaJ like chaperone protein [Parvularcula dongshanensis]